MIKSIDPAPDTASGEQGGSSLATAAGDFDWTRRLAPDIRGLVTTWLEIGDDAIRHISIVPSTGGTR